MIDNSKLQQGIQVVGERPPRGHPAKVWEVAKLLAAAMVPVTVQLQQPQIVGLPPGLNFNATAMAEWAILGAEVLLQRFEQRYGVPCSGTT